MKSSIAPFIILLFPILVKAQLYIEKNTRLHIQDNAFVFIEGDFSSYSSITGRGSIHLTGDIMIDLHGNGINKITLESSNAVLMSNACIDDILNLQNSRIVLNGYSIDLGDSADINADSNSGINSAKDGWVRKYISADLRHLQIPFINDDGELHPLTLHTNGHYHNAIVETALIDDQLPTSITGTVQRIDHYWIVKQQGITGKLSAIAGFTNKKPAFEQNNFNPVIITDVSKISLMKLKPNYFLADVTAPKSYITAINGNRGNIDLSPNPAGAYTTLSIYSNVPKKAEIRIWDINSHVIYASVVNLLPGDNNINIPLTHVSSGTYNVSIIRDYVKFTLKLIKL